MLSEEKIVEIAEAHGLLTMVPDAGYKNDALWFDGDATDFARAIEAAVLAEQAKAEPVEWQFQDRDGNWHSFVDERHKAATVADGSWPIRGLFLHPAPAPEGMVMVPREPTEAMIVGFWGEITKGEPEREAAREAWRDAIAAAEKEAGK